MNNSNKLAVSFLISLSLLSAGCSSKSDQQLNQQNIKTNTAASHLTKPVILIVIDSLMDKSLSQAIQEGRAPAIKYLLQNGQYFPHVVSSFPTMSVTIDSTVMTGTYADRHHVPGLVWYSGNKKRMVMYGNGAKEALKISQMQVLMDSVYQLNQDQLSKETKTIHEQLAEQGKDSASINAVVYRGKTEHVLKVPRFLTYSKSVPEHLTINGPKQFSYAAFAQLDPNNSRNTYVWKKYGMNNKFSAQDIAYLIKEKKIPNFTFAYFPENDTIVHSKGINELSGIEDADKALQIALNAYGSWDQAVKNAVWIIMGDSSQSAIYDDKKAAIVDIRPLLNRYRIAKINQPIQNGDQIVISANERMAYVYSIDETVQVLDLVKALQQEKRFDLIAMKDDNGVYVRAGMKNNTMFSFHPGGNSKDEYGQSWTVSGDSGLVDISIANNLIKYGKYPDVLARLYGAMHSHEGNYVIVTAQPGYELVGESSPTHIGGGAHGSLHEVDSLVPLIVTGTNSRLKTLRLVDIKDWILQLANQ